MNRLSVPSFRVRRSAAAAVGTLLVIALASGCGSSASRATDLEGTAEFQGMKNLGEMYRLVSESLKRPPRTIGELRKAEAQVPGGFSSLGEQNVAIFFGAELPELSGKPAEGASETVLAYDRLTPQQGGVVLMLDRSIRKLTAAEFKAAKKAGKTPWTAPPGS
jgi:hypothetical protein